MGFADHRLLLYQQDIAQTNSQNLHRPGTGLLALTAVSPQLDCARIRGWMLDYGFPQGQHYDGYGLPLEEGTYRQLQHRMTSGLTDGLQTIGYGVMADNGLVRRAPTMLGCYRQGQIGEIDRFAVSLLKLGEPVVLYSRDDSGLWYFAGARQTYGWILAEQVGVLPRQPWLSYCQRQQWAWQRSSRFLLQAVDAAGCPWRQWVLMGTRLPLEALQCDGQQTVLHLSVPFRQADGSLGWHPVQVTEAQGFVPRPLLFSAQNILSQASAMLGEPFGWGGAGLCRDSAMVAVDVMACFDLLLPRSCGQQLAMTGIESWQGDAAQLQPGTLLYGRDHVMLSLGNREILHSVYQIGLPGKQETIPCKIRRVTRGQLSQYTADGQTWEDSLTHCWVPQHQRNILAKSAQKW